MSNYPTPPPSYQANKSYQATDESAQPLLTGERAAQPGPGPNSHAAGGIYDQPEGDLPDDFKVSGFLILGALRSLMCC